MITINTISATRFSFNGVTYHKNFMPFVTGNKIAIINVYDGCITLTDAPTIFSDYTVNGVTYSSVNDLQSVLLDVIYTRNSLTNAAITLTTIGNSGAATLTGITLNIPNYTLAGLGGVGGTGTTNFLPKFTGASTLGNSIVSESGAAISVAGNIQTDGNANRYVKSTGFISNQLGQLSDFGGGDAGYYFVAGGGIQFVSGGANRMLLNSSGNVGIGTSIPNNLLQLTAAAGSSHARWTEAATTVGFVGGANGIISGLNGSFAVRGESGLVLSGAGNSATMFLNTSNNVGIGTTAPAQRLDVNGLINSTNGISVGGEGVSRFWTGTQAQYDAITTKVSTTVYLIT
jgi:hypothetical protein